MRQELHGHCKRATQAVLTLVSAPRYRFEELYESPRSSSVVVAPYLLPDGGVALPLDSSFSQPLRTALTHHLLVQTPLVYPNAPTVRLALQVCPRRSPHCCPAAAIASRAASHVAARVARCR